MTSILRPSISSTATVPLRIHIDGDESSDNVSHNQPTKIEGYLYKKNKEGFWQKVYNLMCN